MTERVSEIDAEALQDARERALELIRCGFLDQDELIESLADEHELDDETAEAIVEPLWADRLAEQEGWPEVTDLDRLIEAFDALEGRGITTAMDFACCSNCGLAEIGQEAEAGSRGFVFFHQQDTQSAAAGRGLMLRYGVFRRSGRAETTAEIGREVISALTEAGLKAEWDGSPDRAIHLTPLAWLNRLPG